jgi:pimeloyl-ACP methyl ester carboxylesterase
MSLKGLTLYVFLSILSVKLCDFKLLKNHSDDVTEIANSYGYKIETHEIISSDGYILILHRLFKKGTNKLPNSEKKGCPSKPPVFMIHSLVTSSIDFVMLGPENSLGYFLADNGYDVWMGNNRGGKLNDHHIKQKNFCSTPFSKYWDFSGDEIATIDLPQMIDYVLKKTRSPKIFYTGFSAGSTFLTMLLADKPEYNQKIAHATYIGPAIWSRTTADTREGILKNLLSLNLLQFVKVVPLNWFFVTTSEMKKTECEINKNPQLCEIHKAIEDGTIDWHENGAYIDPVSLNKI